MSSSVKRPRRNPPNDNNIMASGGAGDGGDGPPGPPIPPRMPTDLGRRA